MDLLLLMLHADAVDDKADKPVGLYVPRRYYVVLYFTACHISSAVYRFRPTKYTFRDAIYVT